MARSTRLVILIKNIYTLWGRKRFLLPVTYFPTNLVYPFTLRVTGIISWWFCLFYLSFSFSYIYVYHMFQNLILIPKCGIFCCATDISILIKIYAFRNWKLITFTLTTQKPITILSNKFILHFLTILLNKSYLRKGNHILLEANAENLSSFFIRMLFLKYYKYTLKMCIRKHTALI